MYSQKGLRILIVSDHYPPFIGGAHRQAQLLSRELFRRGHEVSVVTVWHPGLPEEENDGGVTVYRLKQLRTVLPWFARKQGQRHQPPFPDPVTIWGLRRILARFQPDVVHAYGWYTYSLAVALLGKDIPLLISARDYAYGCATRTLVYYGEQPCTGPAPLKCLGCAANLYGPLKGSTVALSVTLGRPLLRHKVRGVHSISTYVQQMVRRDFLGEQPSAAAAQTDDIAEIVIPSFRENDAEEDSRDDADLQGYIEQLPKEKYILFVGALRRVKGVNQLLTAYERLDSPPPLVLIGTYERDSPRSFPPGVIVLPNFPHRAVMAAWERSLFGVIPSLWPEPLGSVVYEGMSCGKALIGTKPGGHTDMIVDGETGLLIPLGDVDALTAAMRKLIAEPELRERFGRAGRERAKQFTAEVNVPRFEQFYHKLISDRCSQAEKKGYLPVAHQ